MKMMKRCGLAIAVVALSLQFTSCVKTQVTKEITMAVPQFMKLDDYYASLRMQSPREITNPGKFVLYGNYMLLQDNFKGIHIIDVSGSAYNKIGFIPAGNAHDMAMKNNMLYLDCSDELVTLNLTDINNISLANRQQNVFSSNNMPTTANNEIFIGYRYVDTIVNEDILPNYQYYSGYYVDVNTANMSASLGGGGGNIISTGGSMARFCIVNNYLYCVDRTRLLTYNISNVAQPSSSAVANLTWGIETIYPMADKLFIGSQTGMYIFSIANPQAPVQEGMFSHARVCDPVIAEGNLAYVTLRSGTTCQGFTNQLDVVNISDVTKPTLIKSYDLTNPHGLSKKGNTLYICDGASGLRIMNVTTADAVTIEKTLALEGVAYDCISSGDKLFVSTNKGLFAFDNSTASAPTQLYQIK
ncbi:MAG: hypothetical protein RL660_3089 [Bacteroidota bacterium]|jgi:hypothetical protein